MKLPWNNKTGIAKVATILATICILSFGVCTVGAVTVPGTSDMRERIWGIAIWIFAATVVLTVIALIVIGFVAFVQNRRRPRN